MNAASSMRRHRIASVAARALLVTAAAVGFGWAVVQWATPCDAGALCVALPAATRPGLWTRLHAQFRYWYLQFLIRAAETDLMHMRDEAQAMPFRLQVAQQYIDVLRVQRIDADLARRTK